MKKILFILSLALISIVTKSQTTQTMQFPQYYIKGTDTLGLIISVEQAQKLDNDYDMLELLKKYKVSVEKMEEAYIVVVNNLQEEITTLKLKITTLEGIIKIKDSQIDNLKEQIEKYRRDGDLANAQLQAKNEIISNYRKDNRSRFLKTLALIIGVGALLVLK